ncbi:MAG: hypothetical protein GF347_05545 [Candidatus Moranbacteria bacterium]|nr:hypothetical protein [Candidatus Moranbacteria bacterium]
MENKFEEKQDTANKRDRNIDVVTTEKLIDLLTLRLALLNSLELTEKDENTKENFERHFSQKPIGDLIKELISKTDLKQKEKIMQILEKFEQSGSSNDKEEAIDVGGSLKIKLDSILRGHLSVLSNYLFLKHSCGQDESKQVVERKKEELVTILEEINEVLLEDKVESRLKKYIEVIDFINSDSNADEVKNFIEKYFSVEEREKFFRDLILKLSDDQKKSLFRDLNLLIEDGTISIEDSAQDHSLERRLSYLFNNNMSFMTLFAFLQSQNNPGFINQKQDLLKILEIIKKNFK